MIWQCINVGMCLHHDLDHILCSWLCRVRGSTEWETPVCSCKEEQLQQVGRRIFSLVLNYIGSIYTVFPKWFGTPHFFSFSGLGTRKYSQKSAAGNSWIPQMFLSNIPAAGSAEYHWELVCLWFYCLCWWLCSISEVFFLRTEHIGIEMHWRRTGSSISYLPPCVLLGGTEGYASLVLKSLTANDGSNPRGWN